QGLKTGDIDRNASAAQVRDALLAVPGINQLRTSGLVTDILVDGNAGGPWTVTFEDAPLTTFKIFLLSADNSKLRVAALNPPARSASGVRFGAAEGISRITSVVGGPSVDLVFAPIAGATIDSGPDSDRVVGNTGNDTLTGGDGNDFIEGDAGTDSI